MKRSALFLAGITLLSIISGLLMSRASWIGRTGMTLFYQEYNFLKTWWKGALVVFITLIVVYGVHSIIRRRKSVSNARWMYVLSIVIALAGFILTYSDFQNTLSHRLLGTSFHLGAYLFWVGWIAISIYFLTRNRPAVPLQQETISPANLSKPESNT